MTIKTSEALDGKLTISRPICSDGSEYVSISVLDEDSNINFLNIQIGYSDFTKCLMGLSRVDCELSTRGLDKVGLYLRTRKISVEMPPNIEYHDTNRLHINCVVRQHLLDGLLIITSAQRHRLSM